MRFIYLISNIQKSIESMDWKKHLNNGKTSFIFKYYKWLSCPQCLIITFLVLLVFIGAILASIEFNKNITFQTKQNYQLIFFIVFKLNIIIISVLLNKYLTKYQDYWYVFLYLQTTHIYM